MEAKLLKGGKSVFDRTSEQREELHQRERELAAQREKEAFVADFSSVVRHWSDRVIRKKLEEKEERRLSLAMSASCFLN